MSNHSRRHQKKHSHTPLRVINLFLLVIFILLSVVSLFLMYRHHFLAFRHLNVIYGVVIILIILASLFLCIKNKARIFTTIILVLSSIFVATTLYGFKSTIDLTNNLNKTASYSEIEMSVVVPKDSKITNIEAVSKLAAPVKNDTSNITDLIEHIKSEKGISITPQKTDSYQDAYNRIKNGDSQAMVLNNAYVSLIELSTPDFKSQIKTIYTYKIKKKINRKNTNHKEGVFNIYISGIDTFGSISTVSRSDVNIIMTVNTNTHKVLLTENADISEIDFEVSDDFYKRKKRKGYYRVFQNNKSLKEFFSGNKVENVVWGKLYKKSIIGDLRFNEKYKIGEDLLFNFQILNKEHRIVVDTRRSLYTYRIEEKSIMNQQFNKNTLDFIDIFNEIHQDSPTELFNYVEAKFVREKIKCLRKMFELGEIADENLRLQRYKFWQDIKSYSICKAIRFLSKKHICTLYLMKYFPYVYIKMYNKFQKQ